MGANRLGYRGVHEAPSVGGDRDEMPRSPGPDGPAT